MYRSTDIHTMSKFVNVKMSSVSTEHTSRLPIYVSQGNSSMVSCQKGPTRNAYAWQIGSFWQDTLELWHADCICHPAAVFDHPQRKVVATGPHSTNGFSIAIQIRWKFRFTLISIQIQWLLQNFVHGTTAVLSLHVQKLLRPDGQQRNSSKAKFGSNLNCE